MVLYERLTFFPLFIDENEQWHSLVYFILVLKIQKGILNYQSLIISGVLFCHGPIASLGHVARWQKEVC